jgi:hypothetical protein
MLFSNIILQYKNYVTNIPLHFTEDNRLQVATGDGYPKYLVYFM